MNDKTQLSLTNVQDILQEIENAFYDVPFGNTDFQCENFIIAASITPARAYRAIGLQLQSILTNLNNLKYAEQLKQIEILELQEKIDDENTPKFERMKTQVKLEQLQIPNKWNEKLVEDQIHQANLYYKHFKAFPNYTREQFEKEEPLYFEQSQRRQLLGITGAKESIMNMMDDKKTMDQFEKLWLELPIDQKEKMLEDITKQSMASLIEFKNADE